MDFTLSAYYKLLDALQEQQYSFQTVREFILDPKPRAVMLRHDVDARSGHSLRFARLQHERGIRGTYYFRIVPASFDGKIIREIEDLGHEIGYHYEDMDLAGGDPHKAIVQFQRHLEELRLAADSVETACMHGSPLSRYDNRALWKFYDYRRFGLIAEPYFDIDFTRVLYLTDTGRRWDGGGASIRDRELTPEERKQFRRNTRNRTGRNGKSITGAGAEVSHLMQPDGKLLSEKFRFRTTAEITEAVRKGNLPDQIMFNFHPQRWNSNPVLWLQEWALQRTKNAIKRLIKKSRKASGDS